jgi:4-amino-4-deoxy-L-arabinose transferase-like glycosyltransferase
MNEPQNAPLPPTGRLKSLARVVALGLVFRVAAADAVQWLTQRRGVLCVFPDTTIYWDLAGKIRRGEPFEQVYFGDLPHFALRTPGYPLFLAACQLAFGPRVLPVRLVQAVLGAACVWMTAGLTHRTLRDDPPGTRWTAPLIAAVFVALDPYVIANSAFVLSEALFLPLMLLAQWGLAVAWARDNDRDSSAGARGVWALLSGAATGAAVLARPSWALYAPLMLLLWIGLSARELRKTASRQALLVVLGVGIVMAPWWVRNAQIYGKFVPTALWMGASLYDGLNPAATGASDMSFLGDPDFWPLDEETQDAVLRARAWEFVRTHPGRVLQLALMKSARFWSPWPNAEAFSSPWLVAASLALALPLDCLIVLGAWDRRRDGRALVLLGLPLLYTFALHLVFVSSMRYRVPVLVPAFGLAAAGVRRLAERVGGIRERS